MPSPLNRRGPEFDLLVGFLGLDLGSIILGLKTNYAFCLDKSGSGFSISLVHDSCNVIVFIVFLDSYMVHCYNYGTLL